MEDFKVVEVTPHGHVNDHEKNHVAHNGNNNTDAAADGVPLTDEDKL